MNLSLYKLRKQIKRDKSGQGSLVAVVLAGVVGTILVSSVTTWYLSIRNNLSGLDDRLEAVSIALNEWQKLEHMSFEELTNNKEKLKEPYAVGDKFKVSVNIGEKGYFANGKCNALEGEFAGETPNCFSDTTMSIYNKDNNVLYTTRTLPLSSAEATNNFPDYANKVKINSLPYTVPKNGWISVNTFGQTGGCVEISVNGTMIYHNYYGSVHNGVAQVFPVTKGDKVTFNQKPANYTLMDINFLPPKTSSSVYNGSTIDEEMTNANNSMAGKNTSVLPIGTILPYSGSLSNIPDGWHLCDGTAGTPDMRDRFLMGWGSNGVGSYVSAGLPNITGNMTPTDSNPLIEMLGESYFDFDGAFQGIWGSNGSTADGGSYGNMVRGIRFNASWSNPIYGNSTTVQPPSYVVYYIMKIS